MRSDNVVQFPNKMTPPAKSKISAETLADVLQMYNILTSLPKDQQIERIELGAIENQGTDVELILSIEDTLYKVQDDEIRHKFLSVYKECLFSASIKLAGLE